MKNIIWCIFVNKSMDDQVFLLSLNRNLIDSGNKMQSNNFNFGGMDNYLESVGEIK